MSGDPMSMKGKGVLVTGAATGLGRETALEFARRGANIVIHHGQAAEDAGSAVQEARTLGVRAEAVLADLSRLDEVARLAREGQAFLGRVDVLINNAGISYTSPVVEVSAEHYDKVYAVNVRAGFFLIQHLVPGMAAAGGGAICSIASVHGHQGAPEHAVYAGTKGAIIASTRALAIELAHRGIRVNAIAPGWIAVERHFPKSDGRPTEGSIQEAASRIPIGHWGEPIDIARLAVFLCSEAGRYIVGQTVTADGGTTALLSLIEDFRAPLTYRGGAEYL